MQIENLGHKDQIKERILKEQNLRFDVKYRGKQQSGLSQTIPEQAGPAVNISQERLQWIKFMLDNFGDNSLLMNIKGILDLLSSLKSGITNQEALDLIGSGEKDLIPLKESLCGRGFSPASLKSLLKLYLDSEELKLNLLRLVSILSESGALLHGQGRENQTALLRDKVDNFISYLETIRFFNQAAAKEGSCREFFLYFPFTMEFDSEEESKAELLVYPEFDEKNKLKPEAVSFRIIIDTERLGRMSMSFKVLHKGVSCEAAVESLFAKEAVEAGVDSLSERLRRRNFKLNNFNCLLVRGLQDGISSILPHFELEV